MSWHNTSAPLIFLALAVPAGALAHEPLWSLLKSGGQVVLIRHTITTPGAGDPPGMRLDDCGTQRNLSGAGRRHARQNRERRLREMRSLISQHSGKGNLVLVSHGVTISALTGVSPETGEMVVLSQGQVAGRLSVPEN